MNHIEITPVRSLAVFGEKMGHSGGLGISPFLYLRKRERVRAREREREEEGERDRFLGLAMTTTF